MKKDLICLVILIIVGLYGIKALIHPGFYTSHDGTHQIVRLMHFVRGLEDGQIPVRWAGTAMAGYGYPLFIFTYRVPFYLSIIWYFIYNSLIGGIKFSFIMSYLLSGMAMYWLVKIVWKNSLAALVVSIVYLWTPYRFVVILVRAALGEAWIFVFLPLIYLGLFKLSRSKTIAVRWILLIALSFYGLIGSHAMLAFMIAPLIVAWWILLVINGKYRKVFLKNSLLAGLLSLSISTFYLFPAIVEKKYIQFNQNLGTYFVNHFVTIKQLLYSRWGYGFSMPGTAQDEMSFQIGFGLWFIILTALAIVFWNIKQKRFWEKQRVELYYMVIFIFATFMMLSPSAMIYRWINKLMIIDIPWRFLTITTFSGSILGVFVWFNLKIPFIKISWLVFLLFLVFYGNRNHLKVNQYIYPKEEEYWQNTESSNEHDEYRPKTFSSGLYDQTDSLIQFIKGEGKVDVITKQSNQIVLTSNIISDQAEFIYKLAYYPGWQLTIDGQNQPIALQDGKIKVNLVMGQHDIRLFFQETRFRFICDLISVGGLLFMGIYYLCYRKKNQK